MTVLNLPAKRPADLSPEQRIEVRIRSCLPLHSDTIVCEAVARGIAWFHREHTMDHAHKHAISWAMNTHPLKPMVVAGWCKECEVTGEESLT